MLLERLSLNAVGRPVPLSGEVHQADLEQVSLTLHRVHFDLLAPCQASVFL